MMSKSCTPQSRNIPPETATYSGGGGSGSSVVERTVGIQPRSPLTTAARAAAMAASYRRWNPIWTGTVEPSRRGSSSAPAAPVCATGFSPSAAPPPPGWRPRRPAPRRQPGLDAGEDDLGMGVGPRRDDHPVELGGEQRRQ